MIPTFLAVLLILSQTPSQSATPPKAGAACTKAGIAKTYQGKKYTCVKRGKKLAWSKGVAVAIAQPTPTPAPTSSPMPTPAPAPTTSPSPTLTPRPTPTPSSETSDISTCKLAIQDGLGDVAIGGFPRISDRLKSTGRVITKVIFVDFSDSPATMTPQQAFAKVAQASDLFSELSYGKMQLTLDPTYKWFRMSGTSKSYAPLNQSFNHHRNYISEAVTLADPDVDFSGANALLVISNPDARDTGNAGPAFASIFGRGITLDGTYIANGATSAYDLNNWKYIWLNHEFGHALGLPDLYAFKGEDSTNPYDYHRFVGEFSLMGLSSLNANSPGYLAWERWLLDWLEDSQISCMSGGKITQLLTPIAQVGGIKAVVVPISKSKVVVVESRRAEGVDRNLKKAGALVYVVDASIKSGYGPVRVFPAEKSDPRRLESPRAEGEQVTVEGITILVKQSTSGGDLVEITRN